LIRLRRADREGKDGNDKAVSAVQAGAPLLSSRPCSSARIEDKASIAAAQRGGREPPARKENDIKVQARIVQYSATI
jgi:hypothetical protein